MKVFKLLLATFTFLLFVQCGSNSNSASDSNTNDTVSSDYEPGNVMRFQIVDREFPDDTPEDVIQESLAATLGAHTVIEIFDNYIKETAAEVCIYKKLDGGMYGYEKGEYARLIEFIEESGRITGYTLTALHWGDTEDEQYAFGKMKLKRVD